MTAGVLPLTCLVYISGQHHVSESSSIDIGDIHIEARIHLCEKSDSELESSFLEDPEPHTIISTIEKKESTSRYMESVYLTREFKPKTMCSELTTQRNDPKSPTFSKNRRHSFSVTLKQTTIPERYTSTIIIFPDSKKTYVSSVEHQLCQVTKCWSVSDADDVYRYDDPGKCRQVARRAIFEVGDEPFYYGQHRVNGNIGEHEDDVFS